MRTEGADRTTCIIRMVTLIVGAVAAVLAIVAVTIYARRALKQALVVRMCRLLSFVSCAGTSVRAGRAVAPPLVWFRVCRLPLSGGPPCCFSFSPFMNLPRVPYVVNVRVFAHAFAGG